MPTRMWPKKYIHVYFCIEEHLSCFDAPLLLHLNSEMPDWGSMRPWLLCMEQKAETVLPCPLRIFCFAADWLNHSGPSREERAGVRRPALVWPLGAVPRARERGASWGCPHPQSEALSLGAGCHVHWCGHSAAVSLLFSWQRCQCSVTAFQMTGSF